MPEPAPCRTFRRPADSYRDRSQRRCCRHRKAIWTEARDEDAGDRQRTRKGDEHRAVGLGEVETEPHHIRYVARDAVLNTLREIALATAPGSELVIQFIVPVPTLDREDGDVITAIADRTASMGEPLLSFFEPEDLEAHLKQAGFGEIEHFDAKQAAARYLLGRTDSLSVPGYFRMIKAQRMK